MTHGINLATNAGSSKFTDILKAGDGNAGTGDELSTQPSALTPIPAAGIVFGNGNYILKVSDDPADGDGDPNTDSNGKIVITSIGTGQNGATVTTEAIVGNKSTNRIAILADGDLINTNVLDVPGPVAGYIHSNGIFQTTSNVCVGYRISHSSSSSMNLSKITSGATCSTAGAVNVNAFYSQPKITPEIYNTANIQSTLRPQADFILKNNGTIWQKGSSFSMTAAQITAAGLTSWTYASQKWSWGSGNIIPDGIYYFEGSNVKISNGGNNSLPPKITMIAEGSIEITNGPSFQPKLPGYALVSANDIKITCQLGVSGNPGLIYAYGQMEITNQSTFYGWLQAANFRQANGTNGADVNDVGGSNLVLVGSKGTLRLSNKTTVNAPTGGGGGSSLSMISWREVRY